MKLVFLGTGSARPTPRRGLSCACLDLRGEILVFDAGEGTQAAYVRSGLKWNKKMRIFVTHMHGDHCIGLLGLLQTMSLQGRSEPVEVYGPAGIEEFVAQNARMLGFGPAYPVIITEVSAGTVAKGDGYRVRACRASHSVLALSYLFVEDDLPGRFYPSKARELGIPRGKLWHKLQHGSSVRAGGRTVTPSQVTGKARPGKRIGISGDTRPTKALERFFAGCDYLVFDSTFQDEHAERAAKTGHSTAREAASLAKRAGARNLILTHFSSRYADERGLLKEASSVHKSVTAAKDMLRIRML